MAGPMHRIDKTKPMLVEPFGPIGRVIVNADTFGGIGQEIDMMGQSKVAAPHDRACLLQCVRQIMKSLG